MFVLAAALLAGLVVWGLTTTVGHAGDSPAAEGVDTSVGAVADPNPDADEGRGELGDDGDPPPEDITIEPNAERDVMSPELVRNSDGPLPELEPVTVNQAVLSPSEIQVELARLEAVEGLAVAAGETSGPAVRVTIRISNHSDDELDLEYVVVTAYHGDERSPAGTLIQPGGKPFVGSLSPGKDATGIYLFSLASPERGDVTLIVDYQFGEASAVFRGNLA